MVSFASPQNYSSPMGLHLMAVNIEVYSFEQRLHNPKVTEPAGILCSCALRKIGDM